MAPDSENVCLYERWSLLEVQCYSTRTKKTTTVAGFDQWQARRLENVRIEGHHAPTLYSTVNSKKKKTAEVITAVTTSKTNKATMRVVSQRGHLVCLHPVPCLRPGYRQPPAVVSGRQLQMRSHPAQDSTSPDPPSPLDPEDPAHPLGQQARPPDPAARR